MYKNNAVKDEISHLKVKYQWAGSEYEGPTISQVVAAAGHIGA